MGLGDNVGTRWGHLAPEKRTQREGQLRGEVLVRGTIAFSIDPKFSLKEISNWKKKLYLYQNKGYCEGQLRIEVLVRGTIQNF